MEIHYTTKEESNEKREEAFLQLSGTERFLEFLRLSKKINTTFPSGNNKPINPDNFILCKKDEGLE